MSASAHRALRSGSSLPLYTMASFSIASFVALACMRVLVAFKRRRLLRRGGRFQALRRVCAERRAVRRDSVTEDMDTLRWRSLYATVYFNKPCLVINRLLLCHACLSGP